MRRTFSLRRVAATYLLGFVWCITMLSVALPLLLPITAANMLQGVVDPWFVTVGATSLAALAATTVTGALWLAATRRTHVEREVARHA